MPQDTVNDQAVEQIVPDLVQLIIEALNLELQYVDFDETISVLVGRRRS